MPHQPSCRHPDRVAQPTIAARRSVYCVAHGVDGRADGFADDRDHLDDISGGTEWQRHHAATAQGKRDRDCQEQCGPRQPHRTGTELAGAWPGGVGAGMGAGAPGAPCRMTPPPW